MSVNEQAALDFLSLCPSAKLFPSRWKHTHAPLVPWSEQSSSDPKRIAQWAVMYPDCYFCVATGLSGISVIDIDNKHGKRGSETLLDLVLEQGPLPPTLRSATPTGGEHHVFLGSAATGANKLGEGVDLPVMIPVPGSTVPGKGTYRVLDRRSVSPLPPWVPLVAGARRERTSESQVPLVDYDLQHNVDAATRFLLTQAPEVELHNGSNDATFALIGRIKDFGISPEKAHELLLEHWNDTKSTPPWPADKLWRLVQNAYRYGLNPPGVSTPDVLFADTPSMLTGMRNASDVDPAKIPPRKPILGTRYYANYVTETIAEGGGGKSTLTMIEAAAICCGKELSGKPVYHRGRVAVFNLEDPLDELERKVAAVRSHFKLPAQKLNGMFLWSGYGKNFHLVGPGDRGQLVENTKLIERLTNFARENELKLLTIDPLVKCHSLDENSNMAMDRVMVVLSRIAEKAGCAIGVVHHVRKPSSSGSDAAGDMHIGRGASSVAAAARVVHTLGVMTPKAAKDYGILPNERRWYVRLDDAKGNFSPPAEREEWFRRVSIKLENGDYVGMLEPVELKKGVACEGDIGPVADFLCGLTDEEISLNDLCQRMSEAGHQAPGGGNSPSAIRRYVKAVVSFADGRLARPGCAHWYEVTRGAKGVSFVRCS